MTDRRCSFCGHDQDDVDRLVAGPRVFICDRCLHAMSVNFGETIPASPPMLEKRPRHAINTVHGPNACCSFCGKRWDDVHWVVQGPREVLICAECAWVALKIVDEAPPTVPTARTFRSERGRSRRDRFRWPWQSPRPHKATAH